MTCSEVRVTACSKSKIQEIVAMRKMGETWVAIAEMLGHTDGVVNRWHRVYNLYGIEAFIDDETKTLRKRDLRTERQRAAHRRARKRAGDVPRYGEDPRG